MACKKIFFEALTRVYASVILNYGICNSFQTQLCQRNSFLPLFQSFDWGHWFGTTSKKSVFCGFLLAGCLIANNVLGCHIKTQVLGVFLLSTENYMVRKVRRRLFQGRARARLGVWDLSERRYCRALSVMIRWSFVCPQTTVSHSFDICDKRKVPKSTQWSVLKVVRLIDIKHYVYTINC